MSSTTEIYTANTPNGIKITIAAEELGLPYHLHLLSLSAGDQKAADFLKINPNARIPAIVDHSADVGGPVAVFESGAVLLHLAERHHGLIGRTGASRAATLSWLFLQVAGLAPNFGNASYFLRLGRPDLADATARFTAEAARHLEVLEERLAQQAWLNGEDFSIADIAHFSWVRSAEYAGQSLATYPALMAWVERIAARPAVQRGLAAAAGVRS